MKNFKAWAIALTALSVATLGAACGDDTGGTGGGDTTGSGSADVCADVACDAAPTFSDPALAWDKCTSCHSDNATVRQQNGVPDDSDYTTYAGVSSRAEEIAKRVNGVGAIMPPSGSQLSDAEKQAFTTWGCCGGPQ